MVPGTSLFVKPVQCLINVMVMLTIRGCCLIRKFALQVVAPKEWKARRGGYDNLDLLIPAPIEQHISGGQGRYQQCSSLKQALHVKEFEALARSRK